MLGRRDRFDDGGDAAERFETSARDAGSGNFETTAGEEFRVLFGRGRKYLFNVRHGLQFA